MPRSLSRNANRAKGKLITLEIEPRPTCKYCGKPMKVEARSYPRLVVGLRENYELVTTYYRCGKFPCEGNLEPYLQPLNPHVGTGYDYDFDVMTKIVEFRWKDKLSYEGIVDKMEVDYHLTINHSAVENVLKLYEIGCAEKYRPEYIAAIQAFGGVILTIDGMEPLKGERGLYVARDHRTGLVLGSRLLPNQKQVTIEEFLRAVKMRVETELGVKVLAVISDALPAQRLAIENVFPDALHCLCHYHFFNIVLFSPKQADSHLVTQIRANLRAMYDIKQFKEHHDAKTPYTSDNAFIVAILEALFALSNWSRKPKDPCFTSLELWKRLNDVASTVLDAISLMGSETFSPIEEKILERINDKLGECIESLKVLVEDLKHVKGHLSDLQDILSDDDTTAEEGLAQLRLFRDKMTQRKKAKNIEKVEHDFCEALIKFVNTKGELLFNHKLVEGAPRTNNGHELFYKQLKHLLRKVIGFGAASSFLLGHGERIVYVKIDETSEKIREIFLNMDLMEARALIATERKSRDLIQYIMHDDDKWNEIMESLRNLLHGLREQRE